MAKKKLSGKPALKGAKKKKPAKKLTSKKSKTVKSKKMREDDVLAPVFFRDDGA